jgi:DNA polymerase-3 subunit epsilon
LRRPLVFRSPATPIARHYVDANVLDGPVPWRQAHYCVVDLELSGLDARRDEIISFGAVPIDAGRVVVGGAVYGLCRPTRALPEKSVLVHSIRTVDLTDAPTLDEAIQPLIEAMTGRVTVAHVAWVEESFLGRAFNRQNIRLRAPMLDTFEMGRLLAFERDSTPPSRSLSKLAESLKLPTHRPHHALGDALTTAQVFIALAAHLERFGPETVTSLSRANSRARSYLG